MSEGTAPPFVTHFSVAEGWSIPGEFVMGDFPGLMECRLQRQNGGPALLICIWERRDVYEDAFAALFRSRMGVGAPVFVGYQVRTVGGRKSLKDRVVSGYAWIVTLIAVVTNFGVLGDWATAVFAKPDMSLLVHQWDGPVSEDDEVSLKMDLQNRGTQGELWVDSISLSDSSALAIDFPTRLFPLTKGAAETVSVPVKVLRPGEYRLGVVASMEAGWLHGRMPLARTQTTALSVWPRLDTTPSCTLTDLWQARSAVYRVKARHGHPSKDAPVNYEAMFQHDGHCAFLHVDGDEVLIPRGGDVSSIQWKKKGVALKAQPFTVTVISTVDRTEEYWKSLKIDVTAWE